VSPPRPKQIKAGLKMKKPGTKKTKFVTGKKYPPLRGDLFYFDQEAWEILVAAARQGAVRPGLRGDAVPMEIRRAWGRKGPEAQKRRKAERAIAIADARLKERKAAYIVKHLKRPGPRDRERVLSVMAPGQWYGSPDIATLLGAPINDGPHRTLALMRRRGIVTRARNPDFKGYAGNVEPAYLWRLTELGEAIKSGAAPWPVEARNIKDRPDLSDRPVSGHATES
jgi:hypothetical protein